MQLRRTYPVTHRKKLFYSWPKLKLILLWNYDHYNGDNGLPLQYEYFYLEQIIHLRTTLDVEFNIVQIKW